MRPAVLLAVVLLASSAVAGGMLVRLDIAADLNNQEAPATLSAGSTGTTTIGSSQTSASTSVDAPSIALPQNVLDLSRSSGNWTVHIEAVSISGFGLLDAATLSLTDGVTSELQMEVVDGTLAQLSGSSLSLLSSQTMLEVTASAAKSSADDNRIEMEIMLTGTGGSPELRYPYTLIIT